MNIFRKIRRARIARLRTARQHASTQTAEQGRVARRKGFALLTVLLIAMICAVIALASGVMAMSNVLVQGSSDRAAVVDDAALSGLEIERSRMNAKLDTVPLNGYATVENGVLLPATGGVRRTTYISRLGNSDSLTTTGEFGVQAEIISKAVDPAGNVAIRRVEMYQESFARYASFTDIAKSTNGSTLWWALGAQAQGPVHSNDTIWIWNGAAPPQAIFHDKVTTARVVYNKGHGEYRKGQPIELAAKIPLPGNADLDVLKNIASRAGYVFTPDVVTGDSALATMRIEFVAIDVNGDGNTTGPDEGYFRVYKVRAVPSVSGWAGYGYAMARTPLPPTTGLCDPALVACALPRAPISATVLVDSLLYSYNCGVTATVGGVVTMAKTFAATPVITTGAGTTTYSAHMATRQADFDNPNARCYLGGDERLNANGLFRAVDSTGYWVPRTSGSVPAAVAARADGAYLWPLSPSYNPNFRGVIFAEGKVGVSGTVRGRLTLASRAIMVIAHDLRQATSPATTTGTCSADDDIVGLFSGSYVMYSDNTLATPQRRLNTNGNNWNARKDFDPSAGRPDITIHASILALKSVAAENSSPPAGTPPGGYVTRGTTRLIGGTIESRTGQTGTMNGSNLHGYYDDLSFNQCALKYPPPYFPTTGHWTRTQFYEVNPQNFTPSTWFAGR